MMTETWFVYPNWKWLALVVSIALFFAVLKAAAMAFDFLKKKLQSQFSKNDLIHMFLSLNIHLPLAGIVAGLFLISAFNSLEIHDGALRVLEGVLKFFIGYNVIRLGLYGADALGLLLRRWSLETENTLDDQLAPLLTKTAKLLVVILGVLMVLQNTGVNVVSLIAGLGLGGLALALAAQDTIANLFGSVTIIADRPFQVGDFIRVAGSAGIVEDLGFRSTRIRTGGKSVITIPNSTMAKEKIENLGRRRIRQITHVLGLEYGARSSQLAQVIEQIRYLLSRHEQVIKDEINVFFVNFGDFSLQIKVDFFIVIDEPIDFLDTQQEILFEIMQIIENCGLGFAFPTQTLHVNSFLNDKKLGPISKTLNNNDGPST